MFRKLSLIAAGLLAASMPAMAEQLSAEAALERALMAGNLMNSAVPGVMKSPTAASGLKLVHTETVDDLNALYIFSSKENGGYMVVAADDAISTPLIGFSDAGRIDPENMPDNMRWFLEGISRDIANVALRGEASKVVSMAPTLAAAARHDVAPICKTKWDQTGPYWNDCPVINNKNSFTGCAATAMAQIMKAHNWPKKGVGSHSYNCTGYGVISVNFAESEYDWDNMMDVYNGNQTEEQDAAVAKLMFDCGVSMDMMYSPEGSGAIIPRTAKGFIDYFDYDKGIQILTRDCFHYDEFVERLYREMAAGRPVLVGGSNFYNGQTYGHAFVVDGFRKDGEFFHLNWGWSGLSDGYFLITALDPDAQGSGGSTSGYNMNISAIVGIQPSLGDDSKIIPIMRSSVPFLTAKSQYTRSEYITFFTNSSQSSGILNEAPSSIRVRPGLKLVPEEGGEPTYVYADRSYDIPFLSGFTNYSLPAKSFPTDGNYIVTPGYIYNDAWYDVLVNISLNASLRLEASETTLRFTAQNTLATINATSYDVPSTIYAGSPFRVKSNLVASNGEFYSTIELALLTGSGQLIAELSKIQLDLQDNEEFVFEHLSCFAEGISAGTYQLALMRPNPGNPGSLITIPGATKRVNVAAASSANNKYTIGGITFPNSKTNGASTFSPASFSLDDFSMKFDINVTSGSFVDYVYTCIFNRNGNQYQTQTKPQSIEVLTGQTGTVDCTESFAGRLESGIIYMAVPWSDFHGQLTGDYRYIRMTPSGIEDLGSETTEVFTYPNPVVTSLNVKAPDVVAEVEVFAVSGARVAAVKGGSDNVTLDMAALPAGMYVVRVTLADGSIVNRQIIKN